MTMFFVGLSGPEVSPLPGGDLTSALRSLLAVLVVLALIALTAWLVRRGAFGALGRRGPQAVRVETAVALGERRSLMVVAIEGRRLLLGVTPQQVSFVAELGRSDGSAAPPGIGQSFDDTLAKATGGRS